MTHVEGAQPVEGEVRVGGSVDGQIASDPHRPWVAVGAVASGLHGVRRQRVEAAADRRAGEVDLAAPAHGEVVADGGAAQLREVFLGQLDVVADGQPLG